MLCPGGFRVSLLALKAADVLFELDVRLAMAREAAESVDSESAHIAQLKVAKPPRLSAGAANQTCAF